MPRGLARTDARGGAACRNRTDDLFITSGLGTGSRSGPSPLSCGDGSRRCSGSRGACGGPGDWVWTAQSPGPSRIGAHRVCSGTVSWRGRAAAARGGDLVWSCVGRPGGRVGLALLGRGDGVVPEQVDHWDCGGRKEDLLVDIGQGDAADDAVVVAFCVDLERRQVAELAEGAGEPDEFGDLMLGDVGEPAQQMSLGPAPVGAAVEQPQLLGGDPRVADLLVRVAGSQSGEHPCPGLLAVVVMAAAQQPSDAEQWVAGMPAPVQGVLLNPTADLVQGVEAEAD